MYSVKTVFTAMVTMVTTACLVGTPAMADNFIAHSSQDGGDAAQGHKMEGDEIFPTAEMLDQITDISTSEAASTSWTERALSLSGVRKMATNHNALGTQSGDHVLKIYFANTDTEKVKMRSKAELQLITSETSRWLKLASKDNARVSKMHYDPVPLELGELSCRSDFPTLANELAVQKGVGTSDLMPETKTHHLVIIPGETGCPSGKAFVGFGFGVINDNSVDSYTITHEFGHTLGYSHSSTVSCYDRIEPKRSDIDEIGKKYPIFNPTSGCSMEDYGNIADVMGYNPYISTMKPHDRMISGFLNGSYRYVQPGIATLNSMGTSQDNVAHIYRNEQEKFTYYIYARKNSGIDRLSMNYVQNFRPKWDNGLMVEKHFDGTKKSLLLDLDARPGNENKKFFAEPNRTYSLDDGKLKITSYGFNMNTLTYRAEVNGDAGSTRKKSSLRAPSQNNFISPLPSVKKASRK